MRSFRQLTMISIPALLLCIAANGVLGQTEPARCAGCKTEHFLIEHLKTAYAGVTGVKLMPGPTGNKKAINLLADGKLDFAYTCKPHGKLAKKFELDAAVTADWVTDLSLGQLTDLFAGRIGNWSEIGGNDLAVTAAYLDDTVESGVVTVFKEVTVGARNPLAPNAPIFWPAPTLCA